MGIRLFRLNLLTLGVILAVTVTAVLLLLSLERQTERYERVLWTSTPGDDGPQPEYCEITETYSVPWGLAVDGEGNAFISDASRATLTIIDPDGQKRTLDLPSGLRCSFIAAPPGHIVLFDQATGQLTWFMSRDVLAGQEEVSASGSVDLASLLIKGASSLPEAADWVSSLHEDDPGVYLRRLEGHDAGLFIFADLITDSLLLRLAFGWPVDSIVTGEESALHVYYAASLAAGAEQWLELVPPGDAGAGGAVAVDASSKGLMRPGGGPLRWRVNFHGVRDPIIWESQHLVQPELVGGAPSGGLWLAERVPVGKKDLPVTGFSSEWFLHWLSASGEVRESIAVPWSADYKGGPVADVVGDSLYILYPSIGDNILQLQVVHVINRWKIGLFEGGF